MTTKILNDIQNDIKLLITATTGFTEGEEGFRTCETFALSNIKHHRYLSIDAHQTKRAVEDIIKKFSIHGKYDVSNKFQQLVETFLTSFDFDHHPQYDLQWSLLSLLLNLSNETCKSDLSFLSSAKQSTSFSNSNIITVESDPTEEIDWKEYLRQEEASFFDDYHSDTESIWSDDNDVESTNLNIKHPKVDDAVAKELTIPLKRTQSALDKLSQSLSDEVESRNWLVKNVQHGWWNTIEFLDCPSDARIADIKLCEIWERVAECEPGTDRSLSEYAACRELLWLCHTQIPTVLFETKSESKICVREHLSVSGLSNVALTGILQPIISHYKILHDFQKFGERLYASDTLLEDDRRPPLTYEAYHGALKRYLTKIQESVIEIEKRFMRQDDCNTLLTLLRDLDSYLRSVKMLYEVHRSVITEWDGELNWKCASKLLSGLFFEMRNSSNRERANLCTSLYLESLSVYLNIIEAWLGEGRFEDWRNEFVIDKIPEDAVIENVGQQNKFVIRSLDSICANDPVMQLLLRKVHHIGRSIELLVSLDRVPDMWRGANDGKDQRISLDEEVVNEVIMEFNRYDSRDVTDTRDIAQIMEIKNTKPCLLNEELDRNIFQQISSMKNPFLMKAYEAYLPLNLLGSDVLDGRVGNEEIARGNKNTLEQIQNQSGSVLPLTKILKDVLSEILDARYEGASKLVKNIMVTEYKLDNHLKLLRCVYMMETGHIMNKFCQLLFAEIETNTSWNNANYLTNILEEILSQEWPDSSSRWSITIDEVRTSQVLRAVDHVTLHYAINWPLCMIYGGEALEKYNEIFRLQLKFRWALWALNNLRFYDLEGRKSVHIEDKVDHFQARRLESVRFWLMHAIGSIHAYFSGQVFQSLGFMLEKALAEAPNLDTIIRVHNEYLAKVYEHCLLTEDFCDLTATINSLLEICVQVRDRWKCGASNILPMELDIMEANYIKHHTYLALALHNAVRRKDADYCKCFALLETLAEVFQRNIPMLFLSPN